MLTESPLTGRVWTLLRMQVKSSLSLEHWSGADVCPAFRCERIASRGHSPASFHEASCPRGEDRLRTSFTAGEYRPNGPPDFATTSRSKWACELQR